MLLRFLYLITIAFMAAFAVYFGNPERGMVIDASGRIDADTALTGAMTSLLYLVAVLPFFFFGFWKGWKLGFAFLGIAAFGPGVLGMQAVGTAERAAQVGDVTAVDAVREIKVVGLLEREGRRADVCSSVCKALLRRGVVERVQTMDADGAPVAAFAFGAEGQIVGANLGPQVDVSVTLFQDSDVEMNAVWPTWVGGFAKPKTLTRLTVRDEADVIWRSSALAFAYAEMPTWLQPPQRGLSVGDLRSSIELAMRDEWHSAITPEAVVDALVALGAGDETLVASATR